MSINGTSLVAVVNAAYSSVAKADAAPQYASKVAQSFGYTLSQLESIPKESHMGLGCGNPTVNATLKPGEVVLDLGSGGGIDVFLAAGQVGEKGQVVGLDGSADMIKRARANATRRGLFPPQVSFVECQLTECLPINSNSVDCVLSNCVINLLPQSGKEHIFREVYRILKPGGRVVLDDILAKVELPKSIRNDMKQYVSCIGGAVQVHEYQKMLYSAGFRDSVFVDSQADLNVYMMAAEEDTPTPAAGCSGGLPEAKSCCSPSSKTSSATKLDLNEWAASYQIYVIKPDKQVPVGIIAQPLERWWDAFPTVGDSASITRISSTSLRELLGSNVFVVDVRSEEEFVSGHIPGSRNIRAQTFFDRQAEFHAEVVSSGYGMVVFYCSSSLGRGPRCAGWYRDYLVDQEMKGPEVRILEAGFRNWTERLGEGGR
ncbi:S-adenosyl-L-methionine-dependent methyltransferase [Roridomyces roridus]|uniref:Arsenite methyltransferase n=1 Tax=Roridomyces roridus TaxID=1738132 RepID=A0AAD7C633_9AGAR|nr:S-adenosyl-L-methionine-dependent methyltransferase [Roridomyces roridus]